MYEEMLENGIKFLCYPIPHAYSTSIGLYIKSGSKYEAPEQQGISHFLEHMHFRGSGTNEQKRLYVLTQKMGTDLERKTYKELTQFQLKIRPEYLIQASIIIKNVIENYSWNEEHMEAEKKIILEEIAEKSDYLSIHSCLDEFLWPGQPISKNILGTEESVSGITLNDILQYKRARFIPGNLCIIVTGAVENENIYEITNIFRQIKLNNSNQTNKNLIFDETNQQKADIHFKYCNWNCLDICLSFETGDHKNDMKKLLLLNSILGGGDGSRLQNALKEENGYSYNVYTEIYENWDSSKFCIYFSAQKENLYKTFKLIVQTVQYIKSNMTELELILNKPYFINNIWFDLENPQALNEQIGWDMFLYERDMYNIDNKIKKFKKITKEDLQDIAKRVFRPENMLVVILGNTKGINKRNLNQIIKNGLS